jgi:acetyl-CoA synthetase
MKVVWEVVLGFLVAVITTTVRALVSEELRSRLDRVPHAVLHVAIRRVSADVRQSVGDEWLAELHHIVANAKGRPIARLLSTTRYALGLLYKARRIGRELKAVRTGASPASQESTGDLWADRDADIFRTGRTDSPFMLDCLNRENDSFPPSPEFAQQANATSVLYEHARIDPDGFWAAQAGRLHWDVPWTQVLDSSDGTCARWFVHGKLNVAYNCVDRHVELGHGDQVAIYWEGERPGDRRTITYADLQDEVCQAANALRSLDMRAGERVLIYLPTVPEAIFSMLACARLGVIHNVTSSGSSAEHLLGQIKAIGANLVITSDGQYLQGRLYPLKDIVDQAVTQAPSVRNILVVRRTGTNVRWAKGRDHWWHELVKTQPRAHTPELFDSEQPLFILATSGSTGSPKNIVHASGGYLTQVAYTQFCVFDLKPSDVYWCTADIDWITGHSYIVYGPLANRATQVIYEGTPHEGRRHWEIVQRYGVTLYYTAPTLIRTFMKWGSQIPEKFDLSSLRVLGSVGEPINPEAWMWYRKHIGGDRCPIVDTWWQTETGAIMISPLPGVTVTKPGSAMTPLPGISAKVVDDAGEEVPHGNGGYLVLDAPWPSMPRDIWGDEQSYKDTYWSRFPGKYYTGDVAKYDSDGAIRLLGRVEDTINASGHRISSTEVESALVSHPAVAEAAVVENGDLATTHHSIIAFVILRTDVAKEKNIADKLCAHVKNQIGRTATPEKIIIVPELPKTRSGKIQRRLLRKLT